MKRLLNSLFVILALLIATAAALRSHSSATGFSATTGAVVRPDAPDAAAREFAATMAPKPMPEIRKPVRYEAIIENWKRYRSAAKSDG
jgi:hypothetical protein